MAYLRPSKIDAACHRPAILKLLVQCFRQVWPNVRIIVRADSSSCRWRLLRWCDRHQVDYPIGLARNRVLEKHLEPWMQKAREQQATSGSKQRLFTPFSYAAGTWDRERQIPAKAECNERGDNPRFMVTSLPGDPQELYDGLYCQRGEMENRIKEQQLDLFADRTSCHRFRANQLRLLLSSVIGGSGERERRAG